MRLAVLLAVLLIVTACSASAAPIARPRGTTPASKLAPVGPMTLAEAGVVPTWLDRTSDPCSDFYAFACGGFSTTAEIPADRSSWGAIQIVNLRNEELLRVARSGEHLVKPVQPGTPSQLIRLLATPERAA